MATKQTDLAGPVPDPVRTAILRDLQALEQDLTLKIEAAYVHLDTLREKESLAIDALSAAHYQKSSTRLSSRIDKMAAQLKGVSASIAAYKEDLK